MSKTDSLSLQTLYLIPGLEDDFDEQIRLLVQDCLRRPSLAKKRKIKLEVAIEPHPQDPMDVLITPVTSSTCPSKAVDPVRGRANKNGQLLFDFSEPGDSEAA